jgi:hypothetical protein
MLFLLPKLTSLTDRLESSAVHDCAEHPKAAKTNVSVNQSSRLQDTEGQCSGRIGASQASDVGRIPIAAHSFPLTT